ncbi:hypothetical protein [Cytobacillus firmus]|uniref:hypothetical protein n=1 Tax=Cytobacillus firmus TaxID=1399 RepID=UPI001C8DCD77|nr:hypothetical protein [Cytobacillus firmus]MBX9973854.1 hypothetical protein [Cytobacillus firmus]
MANQSNEDGNPKLYLSHSDTVSNQGTYRLNFLQEVLKEQQTVNTRITETYENMKNQLDDSFSDMSKLVKKAAGKQNNHIEHLTAKLKKQDAFLTSFLEMMNQRETENDTLNKRLAALEEINKEIMEAIEKEEPVNQKILELVSCQEAATQALSRKFDKFDAFSEEAVSNFKAQEEMKAELSKKLDVQEVFHNTVMERLEQQFAAFSEEAEKKFKTQEQMKEELNKKLGVQEFASKSIMERLNRQEAITEKISRQLDNLKSVVYERASHLSERFEKSLKQLAKPVHSFFVHQEEKARERNDIE